MSADLPTRVKPPCGHSLLRECPLTVDDWRAVWFAWLGFRQTCLHISEHAHKRTEQEAS